MESLQTLMEATGPTRLKRSKRTFYEIGKNPHKRCVPAGLKRAGFTYLSDFWVEISDVERSRLERSNSGDSGGHFVYVFKLLYLLFLGFTGFISVKDNCRCYSVNCLDDLT